MVTMERDLLRLKLNQAMDMVVMDIEDMEVTVMEEDMVTMERDLLRLMLNQDIMVVMDMEDMGMEVTDMVEDMVTMERDLLRLKLNQAMDMVVIDIEDMEVMVVMDMEDIMVKKRLFSIKPKKTLKTAQFTSITKIATVLSSVRIFKILNNERE